MNFSLSGRHVLVTGASRGIGRAIAAEFAARGARITAVARNAEQLSLLAAETGSASLVADLSRFADVRDVGPRAEALYGPVDVLINNAAIMIVGPVANESVERMRESIDVNIAAPLELCRQVVSGMVARNRGRIVNVSSLGGVTPMAEIATYGATKAALSLFTSVLRRELAGSAVRATIVQLGEVAGTDLMEGVRENDRIAAMSVRLAKLRAFVSLSPEYVASAIADATVAGRPYLVLPRRSAALHVIRELPGSITDAIFYRLNTEPRSIEGAQ